MLSKVFRIFKKKKKEPIQEASMDKLAEILINAYEKIDKMEGDITMAFRLTNHEIGKIGVVLDAMAKDRVNPIDSMEVIKEAVMRNVERSRQEEAAKEASGQLPHDGPTN